MNSFLNDHLDHADLCKIGRKGEDAVFHVEFDLFSFSAVFLSGEV